MVKDARFLYMNTTAAIARCWSGFFYADIYWFLPVPTVLLLRYIRYILGALVSMYVCYIVVQNIK